MNVTSPTRRARGRRLAGVAVLTLGTALTPVAAAAAGPVQDPIPVKPNMYFVGLVNGKSAQAVVQVVCPGPVGPASVGHPVSGQTVEAQTALPSSTALPGYTGSLGDRINASFTLPSSATANPPIVLTSFFAPAAIPTTTVLPCGGSGAVTFTPLPTSSTARSFTVTVTFVNIAV